MGWMWRVKCRLVSLNLPITSIQPSAIGDLRLRGGNETVPLAAEGLWLIAVMT